MSNDIEMSEKLHIILLLNVMALFLSARSTASARDDIFSVGLEATLAPFVTTKLPTF